MALTEKEKADLISEAFDTKKVTLWCPKHSYMGPIKERPEMRPASGCTDCWKIWYIHELSDCPPDKRDAKLAEIEEVLSQMVEMVLKGTWDLKLYPHAKIEFGQE